MTTFSFLNATFILLVKNTGSQGYTLLPENAQKHPVQSIIKNISPHWLKIFI
jgi:hypothetical protein